MTFTKNHPAAPRHTQLQCRPDAYLTQEHLDALLNDFNIGLDASLPRSSLFYHLVNGVRGVYTTSHIRQQQSSIQPEPFNGCAPDEINNEQPPPITPEKQEKLTAPVQASSSLTPKEIILPANTFPVHVTTAAEPRRDSLSWTASYPGGSGSIERLDFKVFRFMEVDTIRVLIGVQNAGGQYRQMYTYACFGNEDLPGGWTKYMEFYVFKDEQPRTEMISVGRAKDRDPDRCIFVRGDHANKLDGWEERFAFWVPI